MPDTLESLRIEIDKLKRQIAGRSRQLARHRVDETQPTDGQALAWSDTKKRWEPSTAAVTGNTLDQAYDQGGAGAGRTITVDSSEVLLQAASTGQSPVAGTLLTLENTGDAVLQILSGTGATDDGAIYFGDSGSPSMGGIIYNHDSNVLTVRSAGVERFRVRLDQVDLSSLLSIANINNGISIVEAADHPFTPAATKGQIWVKNATPNELWFTDDAGTDTQLGAGGGGGANRYVWHIPGTLSAGTQLGPYHASGADAETVKRIVASLGTAGTACTFSVNEGSTEDADTATFTELDQVAMGTARGVIATTGFTDSAIAARRLLSLDIDTVTGTPADLTVIMETE